MKKFRERFDESTIGCAIDRFFTDFYDEGFFTKEILDPFDRFVATSGFDMDGDFHTYFFIRA